MNRKSRNGISELSPEQKATIYLTREFNQLLSYLNNNTGLVRIDLALKTVSGLYFYSVKDSLLSDVQNENAFQTLDPSDAVEVSIRTFDATEMDIIRLFRYQIEDNSQGRQKTLLCEPRYIGQFDEYARVYAAPIGYKGLNSDLLKYLFIFFLENCKGRIKKTILEKTEFTIESGSGQKWYEVSRRAAIHFLSYKIYQNAKDGRGEELLETLCLVSSASYEKTQNHGKMGMLTGGIENKDAFIRFSQPVDINREHVRQIRKLLEMSDADRNMLMIEKGKIAGIFTPQKSFDYSEIAFCGNGKWIFRIQKKPVIFFDSISLSLGSREESIKTEKRIINVFGTSCDAEKLKRIINEAKRQTHGTTIIITDHASEESDRLSKASRAIKIELTEARPGTFRSITAIDGAVLLDPYGKCYAIGAILDGVSGDYGSMARGARFNSAITYVNYWSRERKDRILAVIVSEDDSIDFYSSMDGKSR